MGSWRSGSASASHAEGHRFEPCTAHHLENPASGGVFYWGGKRANCFARGSVRKPQRCASLRKQGEHREAGLRAARVNEPTCRRTLYCPPFIKPRIRRGFYWGGKRGVGQKNLSRSAAGPTGEESLFVSTRPLILYTINIVSNCLLFGRQFLF